MQDLRWQPQDFCMGWQVAQLRHKQKLAGGTPYVSGVSELLDLTICLHIHLVHW